MPNQSIDPYRLSLYERKLYRDGTWILGYAEEGHEVANDHDGRRDDGDALDTDERERTSEGTMPYPVVGRD